VEEVTVGRIEATRSKRGMAMLIGLSRQEATIGVDP